MNKTSALLLLLLAFCCPTAWAQLVQGFALEQISFDATHSGNIPCSEYGHASFAVRQIPGRLQFVQVMAQLMPGAPFWLVRNLPALGGFSETSATVNLAQMGVTRGRCVSGSTVSYNVTVTDAPVSSPPSFAASSTTVIGQRSDNAEGVTSPGPSLPGTLTVAATPPSFTFQSDPLQITLIDREGMGNIPQGRNECVPGATANSMHWLRGSGGIDLRGETVAETLAKLKTDMQPDGWTGNGTNYTQFVQGKMRFAQRAEHPLTLDIHYQADSSTSDLGESVAIGAETARRDGNGAPPTFDYLKQEMEKGQDVEVVVQWLNAQGNVTGGHALAVSGLAINGNLRGIFTNDDARQGRDGGERTNHWSPIEQEGQYMKLGGLNRNRVTAVIAESPKVLELTFLPLEHVNGLGVFSISPNGTFTAVPGSPFTTGSRPAAVTTAAGRFAYVANFGASNVSAFRINTATGGLSPIPGSPFSAGPGPFSVAVDPASRFLYVGNSGLNSVSAFTIDRTTGALAPVAGSPFTTGSNPGSVVVSPNGLFLYVANASSNNLSVFRIDGSTGGLTQVPGSPFAAGTQPSAVAADPLARYVYVANQGAGTVSSYRVNSTTGALTPVGSPVAAGAGPFGIAAHPSGSFVYVANSASGNISGYFVSSSTGALTEMSRSPFAAGTNPFSIVMDPRGERVYVANFGSSNASGFTVNRGTGALESLAGFPFAVGNGPTKMSATFSAPPSSTIPNPVPSVGLLGPSSATAGGAAFPLSVFGENFVVGAVVRWNGATRPASFVSSTQLNAAITAADVAAAGTAQVTVFNPTPAGGASNAASFTIAPSGALLPLLPAGGTVDAASFQRGGPVAPGGIASGFGSNIAAELQAATAVPLPTSLAGASLIFNGKIPAPLFFAASGQMNFQVPWELLGATRAWASITANGVTSAPVAINLASAAPGIFTTNQQGTGQGVIQIANTTFFAAPEGSIPGAQARPARRGEFLTIYCTSLGDVTNRPPSGAAASASPLSTTVAAPTVTIGGRPAAVTFSGLTPGFVGLYQVNVQVPDDAPLGDAVEVTLAISVRDAEGQRFSNIVTLAVR